MIFNRVELLLGYENFDKIKQHSVIVFGLGGVGGWCAESLVRSGISKITIVDSDKNCMTNVNRQVQVTSENIGNSKAIELKKRLQTINPNAQITSYEKIYCQETSDSFELYSYDYVIDAIDSLKHKIHLLATCFERNIKIFSSMGAASRIDPQKIRIAPLSKTKICPLARRVRRGLKKINKNADMLCVYSEETPIVSAASSVCGTQNCVCNKDTHNWCEEKAFINGSICHTTAIFGFSLCSLVINDIIGQ